MDRRKQLMDKYISEGMMVEDLMEMIAGLEEEVENLKSQVANSKENDQKERAEKFLEELTELSRKYGFMITAEGSTTLLADETEDGWIEFGKDPFSGKYIT